MNAQKYHVIRKASALAAVLLAVVVLGPPAQAALITVSAINFSSSADYDNNTSQVTGVFNDYLAGSNTSRGFNLSNTSYTALNFLQTGNGGITLYDTNAGASGTNQFYGTVTISADVLTHGSNSQGGGLVAVFNTSSTSNVGITYNALDQGGTDYARINTLSQTGVLGTALAQSSANVGWADDVWYRLVMTVGVSGNNITVTGDTYTHTTSTNPNSSLSVLLTSGTSSTHLTYTGTAGSGSLANVNSSGIGQVGLWGWASAASQATSITNFAITGNDGKPVAVAGGAYTVPYLGSINLAGTTGAGSYGTVTTWEWDLNNDGLYDDATTQTPNISYNYLVNTLNLTTTGTHTIGVKTTNNVGLTSTASGQLTILTPEPATVALLGAGAIFIGWYRHRGRKRRSA
jgi:hypothetical protein